jgi:D-alanyl-D-alanine carboxypeptidase/D-alanyl-D-alanine-endopeptidase (penicillin-binding protein 4)
VSVRRLAAVVLVAVLGADLQPAVGLAAGPAPLELPPPPAVTSDAATEVTAHAGLADLLARLQRFPQTRPAGSVGLAVTAGDGPMLAARRARRPMLPASTAKLVTAAAALRILGPDHQFVTRVYATRAPDASGVVEGDLVIVGGGDPVLSTPTYRRRVNMTRPATPLRRLAERTTRGGVRRVTGRVRGDASVLADESLAAGWPDSYLASLNTTRASGLTVDAGLRLFRRGGQLRGAPAGDPARRTAHEFGRLLDRRGVRVAGAAAVGRLPPGAVEVARDSSPPLSALLAHTLRFSDNHLADGVFRMLGAAIGDPTWRGSADAARAALADVDVAWRRMNLADGSGLSRRNRLSAEALVRLMAVMADGPLRRPWLRLLPVAGRTGTMAGRLTGTQAVGRVHAKTGTLRDVRALAATVPGRGGHDHHVAVLANDLPTDGDAAAARRLADVLAIAVVAADDGCRGPVRAPGGDGRRPEQAICGARQRNESRR